MAIESTSVSSQLDELYRRMDDDLERRLPDIEKSEIAKYFAGKTLFITGATGFMGKCLVEKILRGCPDVKRIYILMRDKKNEGLDVALNKYLANSIFHRLRKSHANFGDKVTAMSGDLCQDNLGLSPEDKDKILNEVNIIYHNAANVKFEVRISVTFSVNILGTKRILDLSEECKKLELFMYISSAYSQCYRKDIDEVFFPMEDDLDRVYDIIKRDEATENGLSEEEIDAIKGAFPNAYTYSKSFSEKLVKQYADKNHNFAFSVYRPSIVISAYREPLAGWCGNTNGPVNFFLAVGLGVIRAGYHGNYPVDFIPVDMTINALLVITWDLGTRWKPMDPPAMYNYGTSTINPFYLIPVYTYIKNYGPTEGSAKAVWMNAVSAIPSYTIFYILHILLHFIPACLGDLAIMCTGRKPIFVSIFLKVNKLLDKILYFGNGDWRIHSKETMKAVDRMNYDDKELFYCDLRDFSWEHYIFIMWRGLKLYILKEDLNSNAGRRKYVINWYLHYGLLTILFAVFSYFTLKLFGFFA